MRENKAGEGLSCRYVAILSESKCIVSIRYCTLVDQLTQVSHKEVRAVVNKKVPSDSSPWNYGHVTSWTVFETKVCKTAELASKPSWLAYSLVGQLLALQTSKAIHANRGAEAFDQAHT